MAKLKLFEVTLKVFVCAETKKSAEEGILIGFGTNFVSVTIEEVKAGFFTVPSEPKAELEIAPEPELGLDEIPF